jgi:hypothetical protein
LRIGGGPFGLHFFRRIDGSLHIGFAAQADGGLNLTRAWIINIAIARGRASGRLTCNKMFNFPHDNPPDGLKLASNYQVNALAPNDK